MAMARHTGASEVHEMRKRRLGRSSAELGEVVNYGKGVSGYPRRQRNIQWSFLARQRNRQERLRKLSRKVSRQRRQNLG